MSEPTILPILLVVILTAIAAVWDLRTGEIPNPLVALGAAVCCVAVLCGGSLLEPMSLLRLLLGMAMGVVLVSAVPLILFRAGGLGGGDVKLLAVVGIALGPYLGIEAELYAFVAAALYAPARLIWDGKLIHAARTTGALVVRPLIPRQRRPAPVALEQMTALRFAPAIFFGTLLATLHQLGAVR